MTAISQSLQSLPQLSRLSHLFGVGSRHRSRAATPRHYAACHTMVEGLESREMFSVAPAPVVSPAVLGPAFAQHHPLKHVNTNKLTSVLPLTVTGVPVQNEQLVASGLLGSHAFTTPLTLSLESPVTAPTPQPGTVTSAAQAAVPILDLSLAPIHLNLLGLNVDTSRICLNIAAQPGAGNLLGNLLAGVANALNGGLSLGSILSGLGSDLNNLLGGLTNLLNGALGRVTSPTSLAGVGSAAAGAGGAGAVNVLHLSLGPVDLNLLGLDVHQDNCANGPITGDITAQPGPGNLLGNLIGGLSHVLDSNASQQAILSNLFNITREIESLI